MTLGCFSSDSSSSPRLSANASTVLKFSSSVVQSVDDMLLFASILFGSRTVLGFLWCRVEGSGSLLSVRIFDLTTTLLRDFSEVDPSDHLLSLLEETSVSRFFIGFFPFPKYMVIFFYLILHSFWNFYL